MLQVRACSSSEGLMEYVHDSFGDLAGQLKAIGRDVEQVR